MRKLVIPFVALTGCAQQARLPAQYFAESPRALDRGQVAITGAAGGGADANGTGFGGGARVRVGVGGRQEVGIEAAGVSLDSPSVHCTIECEGDENSTYTVHGASAMLTWKAQLAPQLAVIAGLGGSEHARVAGDPDPQGDYHGHSIDSSLALVAGRPLSRDLSIYVGGRVAFAAPVGARDMSASYVLGGTAALGLDEKLASNLHLYAEAGPELMAESDDSWFPSVGLSAVAGVGLEL